MAWCWALPPRYCWRPFSFVAQKWKGTINLKTCFYFFCHVTSCIFLYCTISLYNFNLCSLHLHFPLLQTSTVASALLYLASYYILAKAMVKIVTNGHAYFTSVSMNTLSSSQVFLEMLLKLRCCYEWH